MFVAGVQRCLPESHREKQKQGQQWDTAEDRPAGGIRIYEPCLDLRQHEKHPLHSDHKPPQREPGEHAHMFKQISLNGQNPDAMVRSGDAPQAR